MKSSTNDLQNSTILRGKLKDLLVLDHKESFVGYGLGYSDGSGYGSGSGDGYGFGHGYGSGSGDGYGFGHGYGFGFGGGYGFGYGCGFGSEPQNQTLTKDEWLNAGAEVL